MPGPQEKRIRKLAAVVALASTDAVLASADASLALAKAEMAQVTQTLHVELNLFSGRPRPKAEITDPGEAKAILDSLARRTSEAVPCSEIPPLGSSPLYTATTLHFSIPVAQRHTLIVRDGYIYYNTDLPCYRDPGSNLEKLAVSTVFRYPDANAPGGPRPMGYLACMVPDSLHPESQPCATTLRPPSRARVPAAGSLNPAARFSIDGRIRTPHGSLRLYSQPDRQPTRPPFSDR